MPVKDAKALVDYVVNSFLKGAAIQKGAQPGLAHALQLSYNTIDRNRLSVNDNTLTYRYPTMGKEQTLGLWMALMDELSTDACFSTGRPAAPGLSLQMQMELLDQNIPNEIDVVNIVTKLGRTVAHTRTDIICPTTQRLLAFGSHVKYMPTGSWIMDQVFRHSWIYDLYERLILRGADLTEYPQRPLDEVLIIQQESPSKAKFAVTNEHTNPFGAMHGGCHAMVHEKASKSYAQLILKDDQVYLESIQMEYLKAAAVGKNVELQCETIGQTHDSVHVRVSLYQGKRLSSEGKLKWTKKQPSSRL